MAAFKPIAVVEHLQLSSLGIQPASISFQTLTLESDHFISVRETVREQNQVVIIDLSNANNVFRRPISADSVIMHPNQKILALKAYRTLQIFNIDTRQKIKAHKNNENVVFWKWISESTIGLVTDTSVYHWSITDTTSPPQKVFDRHATLAGNNIINYRTSADEKWMVLIGISGNTANSTAPKIKGAMQLYSRERGVSQPIEGHAAAFAEIKLYGYLHVTKLFTYTVRTGNGAKLHVVEIDHQAPDPPFTKRAVDVYFPPRATNDFPVGIQMSKKHGIVYIATKFGLIHLYDLVSGACIYMNRISGDAIFVTTEHEATNGILCVNRKGQVLGVSVDEQNLVPYILTTLNNKELAFELASRGNLLGAEKENATEMEGTFRVNGSNKYMRELQAIFETPPRYGKSLSPALPPVPFSSLIPLPTGPEHLLEREPANDESSEDGYGIGGLEDEDDGSVSSASSIEQRTAWQENEARRKEEEATRKEEEASRKEEQARRLEEKARQSFEEAKRLEADARQAEANAKLREAEAKKREADAEKREAEAQRKEENARYTMLETKRKEDDARMREEEVLRREKEARRLEEEARQSLEEAKRLEAGVRQAEAAVQDKGAEVKRKEAEVKKREADAQKREAEARRKEENARSREFEAQRKAEQARRKEEEAQRREDDARKREEEARRKEEEATLREGEENSEEGARLLEERTRQSLEEAKRLEAGARQAEASVKMREVAVQNKEAEIMYKEEEIKKREVEAQRKEENIRYRELEARLKEEQARRKEEEVQRKEENVRYRDLKFQLKEEEARRKEEAAQRREDDARKREEEIGRKEEELRRLEDKARQSSEARRLDAGARQAELEDETPSEMSEDSDVENEEANWEDKLDEIQVNF